MKRHGFVANSSSSSFVLDKSKITVAQKEAVLNHIKYANEHFANMWGDEDDWWSIDDSRKTDMTGYTFMDNFSMGEFFERLGIPSDAYSFD